MYVQKTINLRGFVTSLSTDLFFTTTWLEYVCILAYIAHQYNTSIKLWRATAAAETVALLKAKFH